MGDERAGGYLETGHPPGSHCINPGQRKSTLSLDSRGAAEGAESGDAEDREEDNFPSHVLKGRELTVKAQQSSKGGGTDKSRSVFPL